jgi:uncharacterized membrane protein YdcZ (DUF606 family)
VPYMLPWWLGVAGITLGAIVLFLTIKLANR